MTEKAPSFEKAFERLEEILETMNSGKVSLDQSLKLFEEAEHLISICNAQLNSAEKKIEKLIKNKDGLALDAKQTPQTEPL